MSSQLVVVPDDDHVCVALGDGPRLTSLRRFLLPSAFHLEERMRALHAISVHDDRFVSVIERDAARVLEYDGSALRARSMFEIDGLRLHALVVHQDVMYAGGSRPDEGDKLFVAALGTLPVWRPVELPAAVRRSGKGVDAIVLDGDRMIVVDNVREPKWILTYDVARPDAPRLVATHDFTHDADGSVVIHAVLGAGCLAILALHFSATRVTFHDVQTFRELDHVGPAFGGPDPAWPTIVAAGDAIYAPAGARGLAVIERAQVGAPRNSLTYAPDAGVTYRPAPSGQPVRFVTRGRDGLYLHTPGRGGLHSEWLPVSTS